MAQVVSKKQGWDLGRGLVAGAQYLDPRGPSAFEIARQKQRDEALGLQIARATQEYQQDQQAFGLQVADRARRIQLEDQDRATQSKFDEMKLQSMQAGIDDSAARKRDMQRTAAVSPIDALLAQKNLPPQIQQLLTDAKGIYAKVETPEGQKYLLEKLLPEVSKGIDAHQREQFSAGIADRMSRGAYGEDDATAEGLKGLQEAAEAGAPLQQLIADDTKLRQSMAESGAKTAKKQRILAAAQQRAAVFPPGKQADLAEQALFAYQHELIDEKGLAEKLFEAETGEIGAFQKALRPEQLYLEAARAANSMFTGSEDRNPEKVAEMADRLFKRMLQLREGSGDEQGGGVDPMQPLQNAAGQATPQAGTMPPAGPPSANPADPSAGAGGAPASPGPVAAVEQARELTGEAKPKVTNGSSVVVDSTAAKPADKAGALKQAEEAARNGASDAELRKLLEAAGIDPDAPASSLEEQKPKPKRRQAERVGPNV